MLVKLLKESVTKDCTEDFLPGTLLNMLHSRIGYHNIHDRLPGNERGEHGSHSGDGVVVLSFLLIYSQILALIFSNFAQQ